jgi:hypothetical protein
VADVERTGNDAIRHHLPQLEYGRCGRERPDAKRVEEIRDGTESDLKRRRGGSL